ncbi:hypothetical protein [Pseudovibrio sp. Alg231-02]|uniref:hypothetical protein n=1 Tax=Pseudovibrio sp. Alg231-02 TaxID=1922223 RepID=UPI00131F40F8|nr:hypothetical protein [Pseudovibrio sp. Alg231-02]
MSSRNVFKFASLRAPKYSPPDLEQANFLNVLAEFFPDLSVGSSPDAQLITDPEAERSFFASINVSSGSDYETRRRALIDRSVELRSSDEAFTRKAEWQQLRRAESSLRHLVLAEGPLLPLSPNATWVRGAAALIASAQASTEDLSDWLGSNEADMLQSSLWSTLYALTALQDSDARVRSSIFFWLRLFTALHLALNTQDGEQTVRFTAIPIGVPNTLPPQPGPLPVDSVDDTEMKNVARRERITQIDHDIVALVKAQNELEQVDALLPPVVTGKVFSGDQIREPKPASTGEFPSTSRLKAATLSDDASNLLTSAGIVWLNQLPDEVDADIDEQIEKLELERQRLSIRSELTMRGAVLVKRTVQLD